MNIPTLETPDLVLRPWQEADAPALLEILSEPDILQYFPASPPPTLERTARYIGHHLSHWQQHGYGHWAVIERGSGKLAGWNGLEYLPETDETEVAYLLRREARGRGLATQAAQLALRHGFETAGLLVVIGLVHPDNLASIRVLEKCGLTLLDSREYWGLALDRYRILREAYLSRSGGKRENRQK